MIKIGQLQQVPVRTLWENEARDFTPWLAQNLGLLGEALGLDLELRQVEAAVGNYSCDIEACVGGSQRRVVIENQLEATDHAHLGQLVTYAAGLDAAVVIWISTSVREEHREAIDFLNRHTRETVDFFAVALELIRIDASDPAVVFKLIASPNAWAKSASVGPRPESTAKMDAYRAFFQPLFDQLREKHRFTNAKVAQPQSWYSFSSGTTGISYGVSFSNKRELRVEFYIDVGEAARNKAIFENYLAEKDAIELEIGEQLLWDRLETKRACRIAVARASTTIENAVNQGDEMRTWVVAQLLKFKAAFGPRIVQMVRTVGQLQE